VTANSDIYRGEANAVGLRLSLKNSSLELVLKFNALNVSYAVSDIADIHTYIYIFTPFVDLHKAVSNPFIYLRCLQVTNLLQLITA